MLWHFFQMIYFWSVFKKPSDQLRTESLTYSHTDTNQRTDVWVNPAAVVSGRQRVVTGWTWWTWSSRAVTWLGEAVSGGAAGQQLDSAAERHHVGVKTLQLITGVVHLSARTQTSDIQTSFFMLMMWNVTKSIYSGTLTITEYFHFMARYTFHCLYLFYS